MRNFTILAMALTICFSCSHKKTMTEQLAAAFTIHLMAIDSTSSLDSVHIIWKVPVTEKLRRIIDDTIYVREYNRIKRELASAVRNNDRDSIAFCHYEMRVMEHEIDSLNGIVSAGDTTVKHGELIGCAYFLRKNKRSAEDSTLIYIDSARVLRYTDYMDESIANTLHQMK